MKRPAFPRHLAQNRTKSTSLKPPRRARVRAIFLSVYLRKSRTPILLLLNENAVSGKIVHLGIDETARLCYNEQKCRKRQNRSIRCVWSLKGKNMLSSWRITA